MISLAARTFLAAFGAGALLMAASTPAISADATTKMSAEDYQCKKKYGRPFEYVESLDVCVRFDASVFAFVGKEFTEEDIELYGNRIALPGGNQLPILTYDKVDVSEDTEYPDIGAGLTGDMTVVKDTAGGPLVGFLSVGLYTSGDISAPDNLWDDQNMFNDGTWNVYPGVIQQAWVKYQAVQAGIQPSRFDFMSAGFSAYPGYATRDKVLSVAATKNFGDVSVALAAEDSSRRDRDDGVLANYDEDFMVDPVLQLRARYRNGVYHASAALHRVTFDGVDYGMEDSEDWGYAGRIGALYEFAWKGDPERKDDNQLSRVMLTAAAAKGALGYLGVPDFVIDYTADGQSNITLSEGASGLASFEHHFNPETSVSLTGSAFWSEMRTDDAVIMSIGGMDEVFNQDIDVWGAKIQAGVEHRLKPNLAVGGEVAYTWTEISGEYDGYDAESQSVSYPEAKIYLSWKFK